MSFAREEVNKNCMQGFKPHENEHCHGGAACDTCGWNIDEHSRRVKLIHEVGLSRNKDGILSLVVGRPSGQTIAYA